MPHAHFEDFVVSLSWLRVCIWFIDFRLELQDAMLYQHGVVAWQHGPGLVVRCPSCEQKVLFSQQGKTCVQDNSVPHGAVNLPDNCSSSQSSVGRRRQRDHLLTAMPVGDK